MTTKSKIWIQWLLIMILSFQFVGAAITKLAGGMCDHFLSNGMSIEFMYFIGFLESLSVIGLFFTAYRVKSSLIQILIMAGALYTHLSGMDMLMVLLNITNIGFSSIIIWVQLEKRYIADDMLRQEVGDLEN